MLVYDTVPDAAKKLEGFLVSMRKYVEVAIIRWDDRGGFTGQVLDRVHVHHRIKDDATSTNSSKYEKTAERTLNIRGTASLSEGIEAPSIFPGACIPSCENP